MSFNLYLNSHSIFIPFEFSSKAFNPSSTLHLHLSLTSPLLDSFHLLFTTQKRIIIIIIMLSLYFCNQYS